MRKFARTANGRCWFSLGHSHNLIGNFAVLKIPLYYKYELHMAISELKQEFHFLTEINSDAIKDKEWH